MKNLTDLKEGDIAYLYNSKDNTYKDIIVNKVGRPYPYWSINIETPCGEFYVPYSNIGEMLDYASAVNSKNWHLLLYADITKLLDVFKTKEQHLHDVIKNINDRINHPYNNQYIRVISNGKDKDPLYFYATNVEENNIKNELVIYGIKYNLLDFFVDFEDLGNVGYTIPINSQSSVKIEVISKEIIMKELDTHIEQLKEKLNNPSK